eukprot:2318555-Ditylum_brightwellii.AAC.1
MQIEDHNKVEAPLNFKEYILTIDDWEQNFLNELYFVSDGGIHDGIGYFRWVIGAKLETLIQRKGRAAGNPDLKM